MKPINFLLIIVILAFSCSDNGNRSLENKKKYILNDLEEFSFKYLYDSIKEIEGNFCFRSKKYMWINNIKNRKISIPIGIYSENCPNIVGRMHLGKKIKLYIGNKSFLYNGSIEYPYDSISKVLNDIKLKSINGKFQKEIFLWYPDINKKINFSPLLSSIDKHISIKNLVVDSLPIFYFIIPQQE